ncbi:hypothetical protein RJ640_024603 [Escallonia rubra]|uniref:Integrase catalytic domain-containing protein n=1 Tax=Escallonia rubra TaxID=112253 RepID=A0AA88RB44_9ASTE|nr:hypothetical protein RJ640_024603 [Escallonia rubra]
MEIDHHVTDVPSVILDADDEFGTDKFQAESTPLMDVRVNSSTDQVNLKPAQNPTPPPSPPTSPRLPAPRCTTATTQAHDNRHPAPPPADVRRTTTTLPSRRTELKAMLDADKRTGVQDMRAISQRVVSNGEVFWGWFFLIFGSTSFLAFFYAAILSKLLPRSNHAIISAIQDDRSASYEDRIAVYACTARQVLLLLGALDISYPCCCCIFPLAQHESVQACVILSLWGEGRGIIRTVRRDIFKGRLESYKDGNDGQSRQVPAFHDLDEFIQAPRRSCVVPRENYNGEHGLLNCPQKFKRDRHPRFELLVIFEGVYTPPDQSIVEMVNKVVARVCASKAQEHVKSEVFSTFKRFKALVEKHSGYQIKAMRSDRGGEFISKEFKALCEQNGIRRPLTIRYSPQHNGVVERKNRLIVNMTRSMLKRNNLPKDIWAEAVDCAQRKKLDDKSEKFIFIGYNQQSKWCKVYNPVDKKMKVSRDVTFNEKSSWDWTDRDKEQYMFDDFKKETAKEFEMTNIGLMSYYLGIEVKQRDYENMENCNTISIPIEVEKKLSRHIKEGPIDRTLFRSLVGSLSIHMDIEELIDSDSIDM